MIAVPCVHAAIAVPVLDETRRRRQCRGAGDRSAADTGARALAWPRSVSRLDVEPTVGLHLVSGFAVAVGRHRWSALRRHEQLSASAAR